MKRLAILMVSLLATASVGAVEVCGINPNAALLMKSGFEVGELPLIAEVVLPSPNTALAIAVGGPASGSTIDATTVQIYGTFTGPPNTGVLINDVPAYKVGTLWLAKVELATGTNSLTVKAINMAGSEITVSHTLIRGPEPFPLDPVRIDATSAVAPFAVNARFDLAGTTLGSIDFNADGVDDTSSPSAFAVLSYLYTQPGRYRARFTLVPAGTYYRYVLAEHPAELRQTLCFVFGHMRERLIANDIPGALQALVPELRPAFQAMWTGMGTGLPTAAQSLGDIVDGRFSNESAELVIARPNVGLPLTSRIYLIQLARGVDGIWRIDAM